MSKILKFFGAMFCTGVYIIRGRGGGDGLKDEIIKMKKRTGESSEAIYQSEGN